MDDFCYPDSNFNMSVRLFMCRFLPYQFLTKVNKRTLVAFLSKTYFIATFLYCSKSLRKWDSIFWKVSTQLEADGEFLLNLMQNCFTILHKCNASNLVILIWVSRNENITKIIHEYFNNRQWKLVDAYNWFLKVGVISRHTYSPAHVTRIPGIPKWGKRTFSYCW